MQDTHGHGLNSFNRIETAGTVLTEEFVVENSSQAEVGHSTLNAIELSHSFDWCTENSSPVTGVGSSDHVMLTVGMCLGL